MTEITTFERMKLAEARWFWFLRDEGITFTPTHNARHEAVFKMHCGQLVMPVAHLHDSIVLARRLAKRGEWSDGHTVIIGNANGLCVMVEPDGTVIDMKNIRIATCLRCDGVFFINADDQLCDCPYCGCSEVGDHHLTDIHEVAPVFPDTIKWEQP